MRMEENTVSAGASGAIFGVSGGILYVLIANRGRLEDLTAFQIFMFIAFTLYNGMNSSGVDKCGTYFGGCLLVLCWQPFLPQTRSKQDLELLSTASMIDK